MRPNSVPRIVVITFAGFLLGAACGALESGETDPGGEIDTEAQAAAALDDEVTTANSCRRPGQTCSKHDKCCRSNVCLNDDLTDDPDTQTPLTCRPCGKLDELCCGARRAQGLNALAARCKTRRTVCPQSESADICTPCGDKFQHCCVEKGKGVCHDGSRCQGTIKGGPGRDSYPGLCL